MPLVLRQQAETKLPIEVAGIVPNKLLGKTDDEIKAMPILLGRELIKLSDQFGVSGSLVDDQTIVFEGNLRSVHRIGERMECGEIQIKSAAGRHVGSQMSGGYVRVNGDVSDFCGVEMTGGTISVAGDAGDLVGGHYPGSKFGMNRGEILIAGSAGKGVGQAMRRGTIVIGGSVDELAGWNMLAGTIIVFGTVGKHVGAGMKRGTIVLADTAMPELLPTFRLGPEGQRPILKMLSIWLGQNYPAFRNAELQHEYTQIHGDLLAGGRGEIFCAMSEFEKSLNIRDWLGLLWFPDDRHAIKFSLCEDHSLQCRHGASTFVEFKTV